MKRDESGQVLLITLLVLAVATTIGLGAIGRSSTDVSISNRIEESARAFSAAEAGIEEALFSGSSVPSTVLTPGVSYEVNVVTLGGVGSYQFPATTPQGSVETLWLVPYDPDAGTYDTTSPFSGNTVDLCWSNDSPVPAVVVSVLYLEGAEYKIRRGAYDPLNRSNYFSLVGGPGAACGQTGVYRQSISIASPGTIPLAMRIQSVYGGTQLFVDPLGVAFPLQGTRIESSGFTDSGVTRKIVAFHQFRSPSVIFDSVIYTPGAFTK